MSRRAWGEGSYDYRENTDSWRWRGYYTDIYGERKRKEIIAKTRKILKSKVADFLLAVEKQTGTERITVAKWCKVWLKEIVKPSVKIRTYENYLSTAKNHILPVFGNSYLDELQVITIQQYLNKLLAAGKAVSTIITIRNHLIIMLNLASEYGYIASNPAKRTKPPKRVKSEVMPLTDSEIHKLLDVAEKGKYIGTEKQRQEDDGMAYLRQNYNAVINLAITTGMRQGEIFGLKWSEVDFKTCLLHVRHNLVASREKGLILGNPKTGTSSRKILLPQKTLEVLRKWQKFQNEYAKKYQGLYQNSHNLAFTNSYGKPISATNFNKRYFRKMLRAAGISDEVTFHTLRHTHATQLLKHGVNVKVVSERLGHSSVSVTMDIYAHALPDMQENAVKVIDGIFD